MKNKNQRIEQGLEIAGKQLKKHWFWLRREDNFEEAWKIVEAFIKRSFYSKKVPPSIIPKKYEKRKKDDKMFLGRGKDDTHIY